MFARTSSIIAFAALALPILATATAVPRWETPAPTPASQWYTLLNENQISLTNLRSEQFNRGSPVLQLQ
ncbi:hypothetical protein BDQ12DRAFT_685228 [Crucibulum laeve]|uniref:Uncharacterized protein n=1 Tax=Crucibulum laeve TaxID=68775 RepID=A0A5C3LZ28_9AGAR|nr:hypothetical protein BDQ12DRAFT_685228 [Crucibulum laeve]